MSSERVLHVLKFFRPTFTGMGVFLERLSAVMDPLAPDIGHDLLVTDTPRPAIAPKVAPALDRLVYLQRCAHSTAVREFKLLWWLARYLYRYRTVHFHTHADRYFLGYLLARILGKRLVLSATLDDSVPGLIRTYRPEFRPLVSRLFRLFDAFVALSPKLQQENLEIVDGDAAHLIPLGVQVPEEPRHDRDRTRSKLGVSSETPVLIFVGGICARKDPLFLVEHMPDILAECPDVRLLIVGPVLESDHEARIKDVISRLSLEKCVFLAGEVLDASPLFAASDIMVFASHLEGFGAVVTEAMAHEVPPVVRRLPRINDVFIKQGETGFLFDEPAEYVSGVCQLINDAALRSRLGKAARKLVQEEFDNITNAKRYLRIYRGPRVVGPETLMAARPARSVAAIPGLGSIFNSRMRTKLKLPTQQPPLLITTVDAEETFDWSAPFVRGTWDVTSMRQQHLAHRVFERHGVIPTYLVTYPIVNEDDGLAPIMDMYHDGLCEIGAQLHTWSTPPFDEAVNDFNSFQANLDPQLEFEKTSVLTQTIADRTGQSPEVFRAGRYGAGRRTANFLLGLGYKVDSSVQPRFNLRHQFGPNFGHFDTTPFWTDATCSLLELPLTCGFLGRLSEYGAAMSPALFDGRSVTAPVRSLLARAGLLERVKLSPEGYSIEQAKELVRTLLRTGARVFTLSYHGPSLVPGSTPYVRSAKELDSFLGWLDGFYEFFLGEIGGAAASPLDVYRLARTVRSSEAPIEPSHTPDHDSRRYAASIQASG